MTFLWTEVDVSSNGYGQHLARFKFVNGATLCNSLSSVKNFTPDTSKELNSEVASEDMNPDNIMQGPLVTKAGSTLDFREHEGMDIYKTARDRSSCSGICDGRFERSGLTCFTRPRLCPE